MSEDFQYVNVAGIRDSLRYVVKDLRNPPPGNDHWHQCAAVSRFISMVGVRLGMSQEFRVLSELIHPLRMYECSMDDLRRELEQLLDGQDVEEGTVEHICEIVEELSGPRADDDAQRTADLRAEHAALTGGRD